MRAHATVPQELKADNPILDDSTLHYPPDATEQCFALVDCNNFYASCERVFNPKLNDKPILVLSSNDACIVALSNEAKQFDIKVGAPFFENEHLVKKHNIVVCSSNFPLYGDMSRRVMETLSFVCPEMEVYSIDEAFLNLAGIGGKVLLGLDSDFSQRCDSTARRQVTIPTCRVQDLTQQGLGQSLRQVQDKPAMSAAHSSTLTDYARTIRAKIFQWTGLPVSIGIARTKVLAKIANRHAKKSPKAGGVLNLLDSPHIDRALEKIHVVDVWGIGIKSSRKLIEKGIRNALQFRDALEMRVRHTMGINGLRIQAELRGISCYEMDHEQVPCKGILCSQSFGRKINSISQLKEAITAFVTNAATRLRDQNSAARQLTVFLIKDQHGLWDEKNSDSSQVKLPDGCDNSLELVRRAMQIVDKLYQHGRAYKRAGVRLDDLIPSAQIQTNLFDQQPSKKSNSLMKTVDSLNDKLGSGSIRYATQGTIHPWKAKSEMVSPRYTTSWDELAEVSAL